MEETWKISVFCNVPFCDNIVSNETVIKAMNEWNKIENQVQVKFYR